MELNEKWIGQREMVWSGRERERDGGQMQMAEKESPEELENIERESRNSWEKYPDLRRTMTDWGPVVVATVLFVLLTPGLLCQIPGRGRVVEFGNMSTSGLSILVHAVIYFALVTIFVIAVSVHIYSGSG